MRTVVLSIAFLSCTFCSRSQSKEQTSEWLYNLPVRKSAVAIKKAILKNDCFEEIERTLSPAFKFAASTYEGTISRPYLPQMNHLDSAKISLRVGTLETDSGYSGPMKWLFFEYFSSDTVYLDELFETACADFRQGAKQEKQTGFRRKDVVNANGKKFIYLNEAGELRSASALRTRYKKGVQSFSIHFSGSDN